MARYCVVDPATHHPDRAALVVVHAAPEGGSLDASRWTFAEVAAAVGRAADRLSALGLERGDRVLLRTGNRAALPFAFFGAMAAGLVAVPVSSQLTAGEVGWMLRDAGARAVVLDPGLPLDVPDGVAVVAAADLDAPLPPDTPPVDPVATDPEDPAFLVYTSGTTGRPKGVLHAHRSAWGRRPMREGWYGLRDGDVMLHAGALNWTYTLGTGLTDPWACGATAVVHDGPRDGLVWPRLVAATRATHLAAVPGVYRHLLRHGDPATWDLTSLRAALTAGEALPTALWREWTETTGVPMYEALGMSEISTFVSSGPATPVRPGSPGRAQPGRRVAVLDPDRLGGDASPRELPSGEVGRLAVHRCDPGLMLRYWQRPEETAEVVRGDWFVSGDLAAIDADGYLTCHGRSDDVMTAMGYRISPVEVEEALAGAPGVGEVAVTAVAKGDGISVVTAFVVPAAADGAGRGAAGEPVDPDAVIAHARERLAGYKCPREVVVVGALPRTANGKVVRRALSEASREPGPSTGTPTGSPAGPPPERPPAPTAG